MHTGNFNWVAPFYDAMAGGVFGGALRRAQQWAVRHGLPTTVRRVLFIGGGTGRVLPAVLAQAPGARVVYLEASGAMLARARAHLARTASPADLARVEFRLGTETALRPHEQFDAILTFFFLDLFSADALAAVVRELMTALTPGTAWLVADFAPPRTAWQRGLLAVMYRFFRLTTGMQNQTLPDWPAALTAAGWHATTAASFVSGAVQASIWQRP